jgi:hypothetical protein
MWCKSEGGVSRVEWASRPPVRASRPNELPRRMARPPSSARPRRRMRRSAGRMPTLPETRLPRTRSTHAGNFPRSFPDDGFSWRAERRHPPPNDGSLLYLCTGFNHTRASVGCITPTTSRRSSRARNAVAASSFRSRSLGTTWEEKTARFPRHEPPQFRDRTAPRLETVASFAIRWAGFPRRSHHHR